MDNIEKLKFDIEHGDGDVFGNIATLVSMAIQVADRELLESVEERLMYLHKHYKIIKK